MVGMGRAGNPELPELLSAFGATDAAITARCTAGVAGGVNTVKVRALDFPPPPPSVSVETVTGTDAGAATSDAGIAAFNPDELLNVVGTAVPFQLTIEQGDSVPLLGPLASTPSVKAADPAAVLDGRSVAIAGTGRGVVEGAIANGADADASDGMVMLETVMLTVPAKAVSTAEIAAVS